VRLAKVISGGQTGVDRAALDAALRFGLRVGGSAPMDGWAEDGQVPPRYGLVPVAAPSLEESVALRTTRNVADADATLVLRAGAPSPGTDFTIAEAVRLRKSHTIFAIHEGDSAAIGGAIASWIESAPGSVLNVAGPRESEAGLYSKARASLDVAFARLAERAARKPAPGEEC